MNAGKTVKLFSIIFIFLFIFTISFFTQTVRDQARRQYYSRRYAPNNNSSNSNTNRYSGASRRYYMRRYRQRRSYTPRNRSGNQTRRRTIRRSIPSTVSTYKVISAANSASGLEKTLNRMAKLGYRLVAVVHTNKLIFVK